MADEKGLYKETEKLAYEIHEKRGKVHGYDLDDWLEAERMVLERFAKEIETRIDNSSKKKKSGSK